ncbi:homocysteine S-methyltransferase family protein [Defluviimonas sp. WL0024]|uniref:Homocysteine S-methyltransferase family protein n=2 Tax=Albidovulum TaxID=205889 RepID=A0ABT3J0Z7_9RHOB|nr:MULTISPECIES: homocysteine S-methyltransferase family protein [Defluviimonas]MCU9846845.1 homocysteine S-methyltransferase family protein [Defluviimonas sp. WL0024]MCW3781104.1 homocysteine S-methyltransferase family protein [Defluviimonas salinarum]
MTLKQDATRRFLDDPRIYLTDGGFETSMVFHEGLDLPAFSAVVLLDDAKTRAAVTRYFERFLAIAEEAGTGFVLDTATWRAADHWAAAIGRPKAELRQLARASVAFAQALRARWAGRVDPILIEGVVGPAGDGYAPESLLAPDEAEALHAGQVRLLAEEGVDFIGAITMTHPGEAIGIVRAAQAAGVPVVVSFTVETDGRLPNGQTIGAAIAETDAATGAAPLYYMINCAHPDHFAAELGQGDWRARIGGIRANASRLSHAELDKAEELDDGDPEEFGQLHAAFAGLLPGLKVTGGCCGTDHRHVGCVARHVVGPAVAVA